MQTRRSLRLLPLAATIFFCVSGGPFGLEPVMKSGVGVGLLLIVATPIVWGVPAALMTAELSTAMPVEGGYYWWVRRGLGLMPAFLCAWWSWVYSWFDAAIYPTLFVAYVQQLFSQLGFQAGLHSHPWLKWTAGLVVIVPFTWLNLRGAKDVGNISTAFVVLLLAPFAAFAVGGLGRALGREPHGWVAPGMTATGAIGAALFVTMWNYLGWDSISTVSGEIKDPQRTIPRALALAVPLVTLSYLIPAWIGVAVYPELSNWNEGAWTAVGAKIGGTSLSLAVTAAGVISAFGLFAATLLSASRLPFVLAEERFFPPIMGRLHRKWGTPVAAIAVSAVFYTIFSYDSFKNLAEIDVVLYSAGLVLELVALVALRVREPNLVRPYRIPGGIGSVVAVAVAPTVVVAFGIVVLLRQQAGLNVILIAICLASGFVAYPLCLAYRNSIRRAAAPNGAVDEAGTATRPESSA